MPTAMSVADQPQVPANRGVRARPRTPPVGQQGGGVRAKPRTLPVGRGSKVGGKFQAQDSAGEAKLGVEGR